MFKLLLILLLVTPNQDTSELPTVTAEVAPMTDLRKVTDSINNKLEYNVLEDCVATAAVANYRITQLKKASKSTSPNEAVVICTSPG